MRRSAEMKLTEKLMIVPQRESAGARTSNRYSYQQVWAFNHILDMIISNRDFILIMEFHDDIFILDSSDGPQYIDFYQIKTDNKDSRYITPAFLTKNAKKYPAKMSILHKMIDNFTKFRPETKSLHLVSNKHFDLGILQNSTSSTLRDTIRLYELSQEIIDEIKAGMCAACCCNECQYDIGCNGSCLYLLHFDVSSLDLVNYEDTVLGRFVNFLDKNGIESKTSNTKAIFYTLLSEIKRIGNVETEPASFGELIKKKSLSKKNFNDIINKLKESAVSSGDMWNTIQTYLLHDGLSSIEVSRIGRNWEKYHLDCMNVEALYLLEIQSDIKKLVTSNSFANAKECLTHVHDKIKIKTYYPLHEKEYFSAAIVKELFL